MRTPGWIAAALFTAACGASSSSPPGADGGVGPDGAVTPPSELAVRVVWPGAAPSALLVRTSLSSSEVAGGAATATILEQGPQLAAVVDGSGLPVLFGFLDPGHRELGARSTAEVMLYFDAGGVLLPRGPRLALLELLRTTTVADGIAAVIEQSLRSDPRELVDPSGPVSAARAALLRALRGRVSTVDRLVEPSETKSGLAILTPGYQQIAIQNAYRRRAVAFVERKSFRLEGSPAEIPSPLELGQLELSPTTGATSVVGTVVDGFLLGQHVWEPTVSDPIDVPLVPQDAVSTSYEVTCVGPGLNLGDVDALDALTQAQRSALSWVTTETVVFDVVIPFALQVLLPIGASEIDSAFGFTNASALVQDFTTLLAREAPLAAVQLERGDLAGAAGGFLKAALGSTSFRLALGEKILLPLVKKIPGRADLTFISVAETVGVYLTLFDAGLTFSDILAQEKDVVLSNIVERWRVTTLPSKVRFDRPKYRVLPSSTVKLKAVLEDPTIDASVRQQVEWQWISTGQFGSLADRDGEGGRNFRTYFDEVTYTHRDRSSQEGTEVVSVEAWLHGRSLGRASTTIEIQRYSVVVVPRKFSLFPGESVRLRAHVPDRFESSALRYHWSTAGKRGRFSTGTLEVQSSTDTVVYAAGATDSVGREDIGLRVYSATTAYGEPLGWGGATLYVELRKTIVFGRFDVEVTVTDHSSGARAYAIFPKVEGAEEYDIFLYDFDDWAAYGTEVAFSHRADGALPSNWLERDGEIWIGLSSGGGSCSPCEPPTELVDWLRRRFAGMKVEVSVSYR